MSDIIITWPKKRTLDSYLAELAKALGTMQTINYRVASEPKRLEPGDRCFVVHDGRVRGWNAIVGCSYRDDVIDPISGERMRAGWYIVRSPVWYPIEDGLEMAGFRGYLDAGDLEWAEGARRAMGENIRTREKSMGQFDHIKSREDMERPMSEGGMSMGEGGIEPRGWPNSCPGSPDPEKRHLMKVLSNVQSVEHFRCTICGQEEWD